jgi:gamma-glutamyl-gamma-aminobutyrate hydrolase PuuD
MTGICRGFQFINVMNGGRMMHHIDHHAGAFHGFETTKDDRIIRVNSLHHQMVITPASAFVIGWSPVRLSSSYFGDKDEKVNWMGPEIEAAYYPDTRCAGVQYHPEMMKENSDGFKWYNEMVTDLVNMEPADFQAKYVKGRTTTGGANV